jgi:hypothetical protein
MILHAHCKNVLFVITTTRARGDFTCIVTKNHILGLAYKIFLEVPSSITYKNGFWIQENLGPNGLLSYYTVFGI